MAAPKEAMSMVDMFLHPVFCVKDGVITEANQAAQNRQFTVGNTVCDLIISGLEEYQSHSGICLSITLRAGECTYIASVFRNPDQDVFHLQSDFNDPDLRALALAAQELRGPLANAMIAADRLFPKESLKADAAAQGQISQINQSLYQLLRTINNMADAPNYSAIPIANTQTVNIVSVVNEIMDRAADLVQKSGHTLKFKTLHQDVYCLADRAILERGLLNMLSNAIKYSPAESTVCVTLAYNTDKLSISVENQCTDFSNQQLSSVFNRYQREPGIEDGRQGLGLGIRMVQTAAAVHNGTVLIDRPDHTSVRFTMTVSTRYDKNLSLRESVKLVLSGGYDSALIELSDVLPSGAYKDIN